MLKFNDISTYISLKSRRTGISNYPWSELIRPIQLPDKELSEEDLYNNVINDLEEISKKIN